MRSLGIDIGTGSISVAVVEQEKIIYTDYALHRGKIIETLEQLLQRLENTCGGTITYAAASSAAVSLYQDLPEEADIDRVRALVEGASLFYPQAGSIMDMGAQTSCFITGIGEHETLQYALNGECAAGTGAFFEDQMYRLNLPLAEYSNYVRRAKSVPRLAGRCSVFAKTDLIHNQQEGVPVEDILLGLSYAVVRNFKGAVVRKLNVQKPLLVTGGIVKNEGVYRAVREIFELDENEIIFEDAGCVLSAAGIAALALKNKINFDWRHPVKPEHRENRETEKQSLPVFSYEKDALHKTRAPKDGETLWLGVDVGSTSTNLVLIGENGDVIDYQYLRTRGKPRAAVEEGQMQLKKKYGEHLCIQKIGVTGSGRYLIAKELDTKVVIDEISAQAKAAVCLCPDVDTVFEIGGQDSKYISIQNGQVVDFEMNKVCAAGTGSFVEEQANRMEIALGEIGPCALESQLPIDLGERCTVLMESKIASELAEGGDKRDICAGLCRSIVRNYLNRVVVHKKKGDVICLQGGVMNNEGIVAAFYEKFGARIHITPYYDVTGAYGAALEAMTAKDNTEDDTRKNMELYKKDRQWFLAGYDGTLVPGRKTVGIPRSLMIYKFFPMAYHFFTTLGYNVLLSEETNEDIIALSQELAAEETCYPVKLMHGHMEYLARAGVDYVFIPRVRTIRHEKSNVEHNYGCVYMQTAPKLVAEVLNLEARGIKLISPILDLDMGKPAMAGAMIEAGVALGKDRPICMAGLAKGAAAMVSCEKKSEKLGKELLDSLKPEDKVLVIITRNYGVSDPVLNMQIPQELLKRGCKVLNLAHLQGHNVDLSEEYPNLYWPFGQHILSGAKIIKNHPNLYAVYLTNHGCGPDTMISHLFAEIMGDKPYLKVEVDEHQSTVGVITRIEAFLNSLKNVENSGTVSAKAGTCKYTESRHISELEDDVPVYLPPYGIYAELMAGYLRSIGKQAIVSADYDAADMAAGKEESISKEYCTYSAVVGKSMRLAAKMAPLSKTPAGEQQEFYQTILHSDGGEAYGVMPRVTSSLLKKSGNTHVRIFAPFVEHLLEGEHADQIGQILLLGDAFYTVSPQMQERIKQEFLNLTYPLSWKKTQEMLISCHDNIEQVEKIYVFGEPALLSSSYLNRNMDKAVADRKFGMLPMSFAEYLWFYIREAGRKIPAEYTSRLEWYQNLYCDCYGIQAPLEERFSDLQNNYPRVTGGNIRYLGSLVETKMPHVRGNILLTPAYANYASIIELLRHQAKLPFLHFQVDGNEEAEELEKRDIFFRFLER